MKKQNSTVSKHDAEFKKKAVYEYMVQLFLYYFCISGFRNLGKFEPGSVFASEVAETSPGSNFPKCVKLEVPNIARLEFPQNPQTPGTYGGVRGHGC